MTSLLNRAVNWKQSHKSQASTSPTMDLCEICGIKPKYVENGHKHPYCSRSCARNAQGPSPSACALRGCRATGKTAFANFCSDAHAREGVRLGQVEACNQCKVQPRAIGNFCLTCDRHARNTPRLRELDSNGTTFKNLRAQFLSEWESPRSAPSFEKAFEVTVPRDIRARHDAYQATQPDPVEIRTFHSSQCICDLGFKGSSLCEFRSCGICNIVKSSFKAFAFGQPFNNGRFGDGVYSYRNPARADAHATSCLSSPYRVMIACDVYVPSAQVPDGDAVETSNEGPIFVPTADAILPVYVIMYTKK